jgi:hypothetical protein
MRATVFDRVVAAVSPDWGVQRLKSRMQFDALASLPSAEADVGSGFDTTGGVGDTGRDDSGSRSWRPRPRDARSDSVRALPLQRGQSRDLAAPARLLAARSTPTSIVSSTRAWRWVLSVTRRRARAPAMGGYAAPGRIRYVRPGGALGAPALGDRVSRPREEEVR